jgi:hypothetical protein
MEQPILSSDENAIELLEIKLEKLKEDQDNMKAANKAIRKKDTAKGDEELFEMGYSELEIKKLRTPDFCGRLGYPDYMLQNNNSNIHRIEGRINELKRLKDNGTQEYNNKFFKVVENTELMRLQIFFDDKPEEDVRSTLKSGGFKWSPKNGCWQRQLTSNAKYSLNRIIEKLENMDN